MPRVLILGATGYIGSALAGELLRSGNHSVYGLARNQAKATQLAAKEIIPVVGSITEPAAYINLIKTARIHIVVDCAAAYNGSAALLEDLIAIGKQRLEEGGPKLGFVYTSGMWVHGSSLERVSDLDPVGGPGATTQLPRMVSWRPQLEKDILAARDSLDVMILRPAEAYGRESTFWSPYFGAIQEAAKSNKKTVQLPFAPESVLSLAHADDIASGLRCGVEKLSLISGTSVHPIFDLVTSVESMEAVVRAAAQNFGFKGIIDLKNDESDPLAEAMQTTIYGDSSRAEQLLGWQPKRRGMVAGMNIYIAAWLANQSAKQ